MKNTASTFVEEAHATQNFQIMESQIVEVKKAEIGWQTIEKYQPGEKSEFQHLCTATLTCYHGMFVRCRWSNFLASHIITFNTDHELKPTRSK